MSVLAPNESRAQAHTESSAEEAATLVRAWIRNEILYTLDVKVAILDFPI